MAQDNFLNETGLAQFATEFHDRLETEIGNDNLIDSFHPTSSVINGYQVDNGLKLTLNNFYKTSGYTTTPIQARIRITLCKQLELNKIYTLSFDCSGIPNPIPNNKTLKFWFLNTYTTSSAYLKELQNGRNIWTFECTNVRTYPDDDPKPIIEMALNADYGNTSWYPDTAQNIYLSNFVLKEGNFTDKNALSLQTATDVLANRIIKSSSVKYDAWAINVTDDDFVSAARHVYFDTIINNFNPIKNVGSYSSGVGYSAIYHLSLPYAFKRVAISGSCNVGGRYIGDINTLEVLNDKNLPINITGFDFRIFDPSGTATGIATDVKLTLNISGKVASTNESNPTTGYDPTIASQLVAIAQSYINARDKGRPFYYGRNFIYRSTSDEYTVGQTLSATQNVESFVSGTTRLTKAPVVAGSLVFKNSSDTVLTASNVSVSAPRVIKYPVDRDAGGVVTATVSGTVAKIEYQYIYGGDGNNGNDCINNRYGEGKMECDTFVGMVLRGIPYDQSPYVNTALAFGYNYDLLYRDIYVEDTSSPKRDWYPDGRPTIPVYLSTTTYSAGQYVKITTNPHSSDTYAANTSTIPSVSTRYWYYRSKSNSNKNHTPPNTTYWEEVWLANPNDLSWAQRLNYYIHTAGNDSHTYLFRDNRFASDAEWMFWNIPGALFEESNLFTNTTKVRPGDVAFWRKPGSETASYFDSVTHVGLVGYDSNTESTTISTNPDFWVYEMTGENNSSRYCLNKRKMSEFELLPTRFARPYGLPQN